MATLSEALAIAIQHHQSGRLQAAEQIYRQILAVEPDHVDATHLLGVIAQQAGKHEAAAEYIGRAIALNGNVAAFHNNLGGVYRALGRTADAVACYRRALTLNPDYVDAENNLGFALTEQGKRDEAVVCFRRVAERKADCADAHNNLGVALSGQGRLDEAVRCYRRALELKPDYAEAHYNLGVALKDQGKLNEAVAAYRRALELKPDFAKAHSNLGMALKDLGKPDDAVAAYRRALELTPQAAEVYNNLGNALKDQGKLDEAIACYRRAVELKSDHAEAYYNLGNAWKDMGKLADAAASYRRALECKPDYAAALLNLGVALQDQGDFKGAIACWRRALDLKPDFAEALSNLGNALKEQGDFNAAIACWRRALELKPDYAGAHNNLGNALKDQGLTDEAVACYRRALELEPSFAQAHSNILMTLQYRAGITPAALAEAHAEFERRHAAPLCGDHDKRSQAREGSGDRHDRLRVGFVSPDLGRHPVGYFLVRVLESLGQEELDTICYSDRIVKDDLTHRLQAAAAQWRDVVGMSDPQLAEQIRADRIDILFDLTGHTARNRLLVFARKPAPVQITWIGYEGTTGLAAMDYLLADRYVAPEESQAYFRERLLWMPDGYLCYEPPPAAPPTGPLPALDRGYVTFGSFSNLAKITPEVVAVWAAILHRTPTSRLVLKHQALSDAAVKQRYLGLFNAQGVAPQRLDLVTASSYAEYLAAYCQLDIVLDPFPFSGSTTTCEALWMGVPVVTCPGATFASRHSLSHLSVLGVTETIGVDLEQYVERAVALADDLPRLAALRAGLRPRMAASPLCDGRRFAANLAAVLRRAAAA
jgi:predicted O-linked N-acetylglucosamine transferase (SPINDLY family)